MSDQPETPTPPTDPEQQVLALSNALQGQLLAILNNGGWSNCPSIAAHACCELAVAALRACVMVEPARQQWAVEMAEHIRAALLVSAPIPPGTIRH